MAAEAPSAMHSPQPTPFQRLVASDLLVKLWVFLLVPGITMTLTIHELAPSLDSLGSPASVAWLLACVALAYFAGFALSQLIGWFVFGPFLMWREEVNGGPFAVGDRVLVLAGKYSGQIATVYTTWQNNAVRVELGEEANSRFEDVFSGHHLLRADHRASETNESET